jgi:hypothetical protein
VEQVLAQYSHLKVGTLQSESAIVPQKTSKSTGNDELFGEQIPFADPAWYCGFASPYYNESHVKLRKFSKLIHLMLASERLCG